MGFGGFFDSAEGGSFLPIVKFDARSGRISRRDRDNGESHDVDITRNFKCVMDFENVETGFIKFPMGSAPQFHMSRYYDGKPVEKPEGEGYKRGVRFIVKLSKESGGDVRELASNAGAFLEGISALHDAYESQRSANAGKLPIVELKDTIAKSTNVNGMKSTNYVPVFEITGWAKRPDDLVYTSRNQSSAPAAASSPPSTGSTKVSAPAAADEDDFG